MSESLDALITEWEKDTSLLSSFETKHPAFRAIVAMGEPIIPELLKRIGTGWLPALALFEIVGKESSPDQGIEKINEVITGFRFDKINEAWILWGKAKGYL